ncbi:zinc-dependent alcohol dehydrogenase [Moorella sulfitireducens]|uniref:zinc-dependent alcohol dehydrogenase n=1 Tax=Neomoorella sulfitireducens TaxID=2972948 RepID=UPI0021AD0C68|nr:zinc-binding dehydrogenase [Moorella sulfitireducens]
MKPENYKAAIYRGVGNVEVVELPYPRCGDDDIIVRNLMAGICGSDIGAYTRGGDMHMIWKDHEFGHEMISEVVEIGKNVEGLKVGDYVFPNMGNAKRDRRRMATVGGFSEFIHIPKCEVGFSVIKVDKDIPLKSAVLLEPFVIGTRGAKGLNPGPGKTAIVFGAGIIGMSAALMFKWYGCEKVMVVDISDFRLERARSLGLLTCNPEKENLKARAIEEFGKKISFGGEACGADLYIDAVGAQAVIDQFALLAGREASLGIIGVHHEPVTINMLSLCYNNWHVNGCGNIPLETAAVEVLEMMRSGKFDLSILVSHVYRLEQINEALAKANNPGECLKVCISYV